jgi:hypothetical protein
VPVAAQCAAEVGTNGGSGSLRLLPRLSPVETTLDRHLPVATCIGCGARSHSAECPEGCTDLPRDLVDVEDLAAIATRAETLEERVAELRAVVRTLADDAPVDWAALQERARAAVLLPVPAEPQVTVIEAWGCHGADESTPRSSASGSACVAPERWSTPWSTGSTPPAPQRRPQPIVR